MLALDLVNTVAVAGVVLFAGYGLRRAIPLLARLNLPAPVVGGLVVAIAMTVAHTRGVQLVRFDTTLQTPLQNAFFTSIGFGASYQLLRLGGPLVLRFFIFAASVAILQNVVGAAVALALGQAASPRCPRRLGHAHRRPGDRPRLRAALRAGGRHRGGDGRRRRRRWPVSSVAGSSVLLLRQCCWSAATSQFPGPSATSSRRVSIRRRALSKNTSPSRRSSRHPARIPRRMSS